MEGNQQMSREVVVNPRIVTEHCGHLTSAISEIETAAKFKQASLENTKLRSIDKLIEIVQEFEEAMTLYVQMCNRDVDKVEFVKEKLIEQDETVYDHRG